jgi:hypothetical protein
MTRRALPLAICLAGVIIIAGCERGPSQNAKDAPPAAAPPVPPVVIVAKPEAYSNSVYADSVIATAVETEVSLISSVSLDFLDERGASAMIRAAGMASHGSTRAALTPIEDETPDASVKKFKFVAFASTGAHKEEEAIYVRLMVELPRSVKRIEVVGVQNTTSVDIVRPDEIAASQ